MLLEKISPQLYFFRCHADQRHLPQSAGFRWNNDLKVWYTDSPIIAARLREYAENGLILPEVQTAVASHAASYAADSSIVIPAPPGLDYLPFQKAGIDYALQRPGALIADQMGLGKTIQAIGLINAEPSIERSLIVVPNHLKANWRQELEKWIVPDHRRHKTLVVEGNTKLPPWKQYDTLIVNYEAMGRLFEILSPQPWDLVVCDEAHMLKNPKAQRTKNTLKIKTERRLFLTGTPVLNRPVELWPMLNALEPQIWGNWMWYVRRYCQARTGKWGIDTSGASNLAELQAKLRSTIMIRRLKRDVLTELPPKLRSVIPVTPSKPDWDAINAMQEAMQEHHGSITDFRDFSEEANQSDEPISAYQSAVEGLNQARGLGLAAITRAREQVALAKLRFVADLVADLIDEHGKVVLFARHHSVIDAYRAIWPKESVYVDGRVQPADRQLAVNRFQNDPGCKLFIGSFATAGTGFTLTAASHVVFAEQDWTPGIIEQAEDRCHRIGQQDTVNVYHVVFDGTIDANMTKTMLAKQRIADAAVG